MSTAASHLLFGTVSEDQLNDLRKLVLSNYDQMKIIHDAQASLHAFLNNVTETFDARKLVNTYVALNDYANDRANCC